MKKKLFALLLTCILMIPFSQDIAYSGDCYICSGSGECTLCGGDGIYSEQYNITCNGCKGSGICPYCYGNGQTDGLEKPELTVTLNSDNTVTITYAVSDTNANSVSIHRIDPDGEDYNIHFDTKLTGTFTDTQAQQGKKYIYYVIANAMYGTYGESEHVTLSTQLTEVPVISKDDSCGLCNAVKLSIYFKDGLEKLFVYRSTTKDGSYTKIATLSDLESSVTGQNVAYIYDTNVKVNKAYYYKVQGLSDCDISGELSPVVSFKTTKGKKSVNKVNIPSFTKFSGYSTYDYSTGKTAGNSAAYCREEYFDVSPQLVAQYIKLLKSSDYQLACISSNNMVSYPFIYYTLFYDYAGSANMNRGAGTDMKHSLIPCDFCLSFSMGGGNHLVLQYSSDFDLVTPNEYFSVSTTLSENDFTNSKKVYSTSDLVKPPEKCLACGGDGKCHVCSGMGPNYVTGYGVTKGKYIDCTACEGKNICFKCGGTGNPN